MIISRPSSGFMLDAKNNFSERSRLNSGRGEAVVISRPSIRVRLFMVNPLFGLMERVIFFKVAWPEAGSAEDRKIRRMERKAINLITGPGQDRP